MSNARTKNAEPLWRRLRMTLLEVPATRLALAIVPRLPRGAVLGLARFAANAGYACSPAMRRLGLTNLDLAFGDTKTPAEKRRILRESMRNFMLVLLDMIWFSRDSVARLQRWFRAAPSLQAVMAQREATVGITGHFGNWELTGRYWAEQTGGLMSVAMPLKNPAVDKLVTRVRQLNNQIVVPRDGALRKLVGFLRAGGTIGLLLDQNTPPREGGIFANFFGKPVAVSPAAGVLATMTRARILFGYTLPQPDGTYLAEAPRAIAAAEISAMDRKTATADLTQRITEFYEEAIRAHPECWLWTYRRWRYMPPGAVREDFPYYAK